MNTLQQQIQAQKQIKSEILKDLFYVDYCYHCKEPEIRTSENITCKHQWYCHHDHGPVQLLESKINRIYNEAWVRGYMCSYEHKALKELGNEKWELIKECRKKMPKIKHQRGRSY